jgi:hypothetical protein
VNANAATPEKKAVVALSLPPLQSALRTGSNTQVPESNPTSGKGGIVTLDAKNQKTAATKEVPQPIIVATCSIVADTDTPTALFR